MTEPTATTASAAERPTWEEQAIDAYQHEQTARRRRHIGCAAPDIAALTTKLADLGITPIDDPCDRPCRVAEDGTVTALIAGPDVTSDDLDDFERRRVLACARAGRLWLRTTRPGGYGVGDVVVGDVVGELHTLADVGRAIAEGPQPLPTPVTNYDLAERRLRDGWGEASLDGHAICQALEGLTHAVLAVADELRDAHQAAIGGCDGRGTPGGAR